MKTMLIKVTDETYQGIMDTADEMGMKAGESAAFLIYRALWDRELRRAAELDLEAKLQQMSGAAV